MPFGLIRRAKGLVAFVAGLLTSTVLVVIAAFVFDINETRNKRSSQDVFTQFLRVDTDVSTPVTTPSLQRGLKELAELSGGFERMVSLRQLLASTNELEALELLEQSDAIESDYLRLKVRIEVFRRLASFNPELATSRVMAYPQRTQEHLLPVVVGEWASSDLQAAVDQISRLDKSLMREAIRSLVLNAENLGEDDLREIAAAVEFDGAVSGLIEEIAVETAIHDPEKYLGTPSSTTRGATAVNQTRWRLSQKHGSIGMVGTFLTALPNPFPIHTPARSCCKSCSKVSEGTIPRVHLNKPSGC